MSSATRATEAALATFTDRVAACTTAALNVAALARPKVDAALKVCDATVSAEAALQLDLADLPASVVGEQARQAVSLLHASIRRVDERSTFLRWLDACVSHGGLDACEQASLLTSVASQEESDQLQRTGSTLERLRTEADAEAARRSARALAAAAGVATACRQAKGEATTASMPTSRQREKAVEDVATYAPEALPSVLRDMEAACDSR
jgi:hypothetical protein